MGVARFRNLILVASLLAVHSGRDAAGDETTLPTAEASADLAPLFAFKVAHGLPDNITNVQTWDGPWRAAGSEGLDRKSVV